MNKFFALVLGMSLAASMAQAQTAQSEYLKALDAFTVEDMRSALAKAREHGLNVKNYWTDAMENQYYSEPSSAALKEQTKAAYLKLLQHLNSGTVNPTGLGKDVRVAKKSFTDAKQFATLTAGANAQSLLQSYSPQNPAYRSLQEAFRRVNGLCSEGQWTAIPAAKKPLKLNTQDPSVPAIKNRLRQLGYAISNTDATFDAQTLAAVNDVQTTLRFRPDGVISPNGKTFKYLNASCDSLLNQIRADLEKLRWFPRDFGDRYIYVNLAQTYMQVVDREQGINQTMKTINGRVARKSPTLIDRITYVVLNPFWVVPPTVFREDKLKDIQSMNYWDVQNYFLNNHYQVWNKKFTQQYHPNQVNWPIVTDSSDIYIRQLPGRHNALGVLKFVLTNDFAIYLHDTNQRELFADYERQLSSGCVRVERPYDLAELLLRGTKWDRRAIETQTAQPGQVLSKDTYAQVPKPMPVYMVFQTATLSSDGILRFAEDTYGQQSRILKAR